MKLTIAQTPYLTKQLGIGLLALLLLGVAYAGMIEPYWIEVREVKVQDPAFARGWGSATLMHLSDLHITRAGRREAALFRLIEEYRPDLIVFTGDLAQWGADPVPAVALLDRLRAPLGVYGVLGDADRSTGRHSCLFCHPRGDLHSRRTHSRLLQDEFQHVPLPGGSRLTLIGLDTDTDSEVATELRLQASATGLEPVVILKHSSQSWSELDSDRPSFWLSGDTHGGQIRLWTSLWRWLVVKPDLFHMQGLYRHGRRWLYVNRGLGVTRSFPFRVGVRPEVTIFRFEEAAK
jgi:predicted MPP superfamily phosphohydrolase